MKILTILHTAKEVDAEVARINSAAPPGEARRLLGVELTARNLNTFSALQPSIAARIILPDLTNASATLWPPPTPFIAPPMPPYDSRASAHWGEQKAQQEAIARDNAEREREQFEKNAEAAQRASGAPVWWKRYGHPVELRSRQNGKVVSNVRLRRPQPEAYAYYASELASAHRN